MDYWVIERDHSVEKKHSHDEDHFMVAIRCCEVMESIKHVSPVEAWDFYIHSEDGRTTYWKREG